MKFSSQLKLFIQQENSGLRSFFENPNSRNLNKRGDSIEFLLIFK